MIGLVVATHGSLATALLETAAGIVGPVERAVAVSVDANTSVDEARARLGVTVVSFGFRYGLPANADLVLDVRFLPNPFFVPALRPHNGTEPEVRDFVLGQPDAEAFLARLTDFGAFLLPRYRAEGKSYLTIAIGCTGGKHRSVAIAGELARRLEVSGQSVRLWHRDVEKE